MKPLYVLVALSVSLLGGMAVGQNDQPAAVDEMKPRVPEQQIYVVSREKNTNAAVLGGTVIPFKMVNLTAQIPGDVQFIAGEEGDAFGEGATLVQLDVSSMVAKRQAAVAGLNSAHAALGNAHVQYEREVLTPNSQSNSMLGGMPGMVSMFSDPMRSMMGQGSPGYERRSNLYGQGVQIQAARDQVAQAEAGIRELDANIENATSVAPFDGVIVKKMVEVGDIVQPGMPLVVFADTSRMEIQIEVPTRLVSALSEGAQLKARLDRGKEPVSVTVSRIFPMANMGGHTTTVKVALPDGSGARAGMYAEVLVPDPSNDQFSPLTIPATAISWRGSLPTVFLVSPDRTELRMRALRLGAVIGDQVAVLSGLDEGDAILRAPDGSVRSGQYSSGP
ncbi:MAG: efflux RND transporter periplasmic adaptor subunit [Chromatiaceae bacterium]|nr:efflux RND transporter periplasmic adaptor subunit [Chromatiaceae bacterium]